MSSFKLSLIAADSSLPRDSFLLRFVVVFGVGDLALRLAFVFGTVLHLAMIFGVGDTFC